MVTRKPFWIVFLAGVAILVLLSRFAEQHGGVRSVFLNSSMSSAQSFHSRAKPEPPALLSAASLSPLKSLASSAVEATPSPTPADPIPAPVAVATSSPGAQPAGDLKDSAQRLDTIESVANFADQLFNAEGFNEAWTVNQQGIDQQDYHLADGTAVTAWMGEDESGSGVVRAQEAQLPNGEVVDRWFENGQVQQTMHQYDQTNSVSVYYYDSGSVEAMRIIQNGREIFMKYDRNGLLIQKTIN